MTRSSRFRDALRTKIADHFEMTLATAGALVAILATTTQLLTGEQGYIIIFCTWFQGFIFWAVLRHTRLGREHLVRKLRVMLQDRVNNQLTVLVGLTDIHISQPSPNDGEDVEIALAAARAVSRELEMLSIDSLRSWEARYSKHLPASIR